MTEANDTIRLALPKGHLEEGVMALLADANIRVRATSRGYRPSISLPGFETKILRPQNIVEMLALGSRDVGFAGADWVAEVDADLVELLDCGLDPVRLVAAAPADLLGPDGQLPARRLVVASEYERLTRSWIESRRFEAAFVRSYGATEVFPPEDADLIVDNTSTGSTLRANKLAIVDELMRSALRWFREGPPTKVYRYNSECWQLPSLRHEMSSCEPCYSWNVFHSHQLGDRAKYLEGMYSLFTGMISRRTYTACETRGGVHGTIFGALPVYLARLAVIDRPQVAVQHFGKVDAPATRRPIPTNHKRNSMPIHCLPFLFASLPLRRVRQATQRNNHTVLCNVVAVGRLPVQYLRQRTRSMVCEWSHTPSAA